VAALIALINNGELIMKSSIVKKIEHQNGEFYASLWREQDNGHGGREDILLSGHFKPRHFKSWGRAAIALTSAEKKINGI